MHFVPSMLNAFLEYVADNRIDTQGFTALQKVFTSGEALEKHHVERFFHLVRTPRQVRLINLYGPTEATVDVSYFDCADAGLYKKAPIGKPIDNTELFVLGKNRQLLPVNVPGELCIGGVGVARGYLKLPGLTAEKFIDAHGKRLYRTGDLARRLPDGNIEFLGRIDQQVKIRGFRIEPGEIENLLNRHPLVDASVVAARRIGLEDTRLVAWCRLKDQAETPDFKAFLRPFLPEYMIPSVFVKIWEIPLLSNGKTDFKSLPEPFAGEKRVIGERQYHNEFEKTLAGIWSRLLRHEEFDLDDNFYDAGGYSLLLIKMKHEIDTIFDVEMPLVDLFSLPTIRLMAVEIAEKNHLKLKQKITNRAVLQRMAISKQKSARHENR